MTIVLCLVLVDELPAGWVLWNAPTEGFSLTMPKPDRSQMTDKDANADPVTIQIFRARQGKVQFLVTVSEFAERYISQPPKTIYDNARQGSLARSGGSVIREKEHVLGKTSGREFVLKIKENAFIRAQVFVFNKRQYSVMMAAEKQEQLENDDAQRFFNSFKLLPITSGKSK
jgi:hypothetical protein